MLIPKKSTEWDRFQRSPSMMNFLKELCQPPPMQTRSKNKEEKHESNHYSKPDKDEQQVVIVSEPHKRNNKKLASAPSTNIKRKSSNNINNAQPEYKKPKTVVFKENKVKQAYNNHSSDELKSR